MAFQGQTKLPKWLKRVCWAIPKFERQPALLGLLSLWAQLPLYYFKIALSRSDKLPRWRKWVCWTLLRFERHIGWSGMFIHVSSNAFAWFKYGILQGQISAKVFKARFAGALPRFERRPAFWEFVVICWAQPHFALCLWGILKVRQMLKAVKASFSWAFKIWETARFPWMSILCEVNAFIMFDMAFPRQTSPQALKASVLDRTKVARSWVYSSVLQVWGQLPFPSMKWLLNVRHITKLLEVPHPGCGTCQHLAYQLVKTIEHKELDNNHPHN